jgi:phosphosulfolactate synthase (CoM biosynthesis protein A)
VAEDQPGGLPDFLDMVKLGWGTAYVSGDLRAKVAACRAAGGNIPPDEVLSVETPRRGLRADTASLAGRDGADVTWSAEDLLERSG